MHTPPTVHYPVGRVRFLALAVLVIGCALAAAQLSWMAFAESIGWPQLAGLVAAVSAAAGLVFAWRHAARGVLSWDGQAWW